MTLNTNAIGQLLGAYLHQDWAAEFQSDEAALQAMVKGEPVKQIREAVQELDALLRTHLTESEFTQVLTEDVGCYFNPGYMNMTYREWLTRVRDVFVQGSK